MKQLLSGNEAIALGAYHAGVAVATAYPGTPSTEILQSIARMDGLYAEWAINEKVAFMSALRRVLNRRTRWSENLFAYLLNLPSVVMILVLLTHCLRMP